MPAGSALSVTSMPGDSSISVVSGAVPSRTLGSIDATTPTRASAANVDHESRRFLCRSPESATSSAPTAGMSTAISGSGDESVPPIRRQAPGLASRLAC